MRRLNVFLIVFLFFLGSLYAQPGRDPDPTQPPTDKTPERVRRVEEAPAQEADTETLEPFPLAPIILYAEGGTVSWSPDWTIPPDAFTAASARAVTLILDSGQYQVARDRTGALVEFPARVNGVLTQFRAVFDKSGKLKTLVINPEASAPPAGDKEAAGSGSNGAEASGEEPAQQVLTGQVDFLEEDGGPVAKISCGKTVCFVALGYGGGEISETWYGEDGQALVFFTTRFRPSEKEPQILSISQTGGQSADAASTDMSPGEETTEWYQYDSFGNISALDSPGGRFSVFCSGRNLPRYWEHQTLPEGSSQSYALQWDERGFLIRVSSTVPGMAKAVASEADPGESADSGSADFGSNGFLDLRYEYLVDERGNWTERRETRMSPSFGVLIPVPGVIIKRIIDYGA